MANIPADAVRIKNKPLALGEVSGHHHSLIAEREESLEMYEKDGTIYVRINDDMPLTHQEHKGHHCPANVEGIVRIAEEVTDWGTRQVAD